MSFDATYTANAQRVLVELVIAPRSGTTSSRWAVVLVPGGENFGHIIESRFYEG